MASISSNWRNSCLAAFATLQVLSASGSCAQTAEAAPTPTAVSAAPQVDVPLWQGLTYGMPIDEVAVRLGTVEGIRSTRVVRKRDKPAKIEVEYLDGGIVILGSRNVIDLSFENDLLKEVKLTSKDCTAVVLPKMRSYAQTFSSLYGQPRTQREVTSSGETFGQRATYSHEGTHVVLRFYVEYPTQYEPSAPGSGGAGLLADVLGAISSNEAESRCPEARGVVTVVEVTYSSEAAESASSAASARKQQEMIDKAKKQF